MKTTTIRLPRFPLVPLATLLAVALLLGGRAAAQSTQVQTFRYDAAGRLTRVTYDGATTISKVFDANGNVTSENVTPTPPPDPHGGGGGGRCFIATAAYGSPLDAHVQTLREFRDEHLRTNAPGRAFVALYERTSPPIAAYIADHDALRAVTRWLLAPLVYAIAYPKSAALAAAGLLAGWLAWRRRRARALQSTSSSISTS